MGFFHLMFFSYFLFGPWQTTADEPHYLGTVNKRWREDDFYPIHMLKQANHKNIHLGEEDVRKYSELDHKDGLHSAAGNTKQEQDPRDLKTSPKLKGKVKHSDDDAAETGDKQATTEAAGFLNNMWSNMKDLGKKIASAVGAGEATTESELEDNSSGNSRRNAVPKRRHAPVKKSKPMKRRRIHNHAGHTSPHSTKAVITKPTKLVEVETEELWTTFFSFTEYILSDSAVNVKDPENEMANRFSNDSEINFDVSEASDIVRDVPDEQEYVDEEEHIRKEIVKVKKTGPKPDEKEMELIDKLKKESTIIRHEGKKIKLQNAVNTTRNNGKGTQSETHQEMPNVDVTTAGIGGQETEQSELGLNEDRLTEQSEEVASRAETDYQNNGGEISDMEENEQAIDSLFTKEDGYEQSAEVLPLKGTTEINNDEYYDEQNVVTEREDDENKMGSEYIGGVDQEEAFEHSTVSQDMGTTGAKVVHRSPAGGATHRPTKAPTGTAKDSKVEESILISEDEKIIHRVGTHTGRNDTAKRKWPPNDDNRYTKGPKTRKGEQLKSGKTPGIKITQAPHKMAASVHIHTTAATLKTPPSRTGIPTTTVNDVLFPPTDRLAHFMQNRAPNGIKHLVKEVEESVRVFPGKAKNVIDVVNKESISAHDSGAGIRGNTPDWPANKDHPQKGRAGQFDMKESHMRKMHLTENPITHEKSGSFVDTVKMSKTRRHLPPQDGMIGTAGNQGRPFQWKRYMETFPNRLYKKQPKFYRRNPFGRRPHST